MKFVARGFELIANVTRQFDQSVSVAEFMKVMEEQQPLYDYTNSAN